jgi:hypothetical protein
MAVETASMILKGKIGVIEGSRIMGSLLRETGISEDDEDYLSFVAIDSETDALPVGEVRQHWSSDALKEKDILIEKAENFYRQIARDACENIIKRWTDTI